MKYLVRAVKYFVYICVIVTLILFILVLLKAVSPDINVMFKNGWKSVWLILGMFAAVSLIYPRFGYAKRLARVLGDYADLRADVIEYMESRGYRLETETDEKITFRSKSVMNRIMRVWEDRITLEKELGGFYVEGPGRDIVRLIAGLEYKFQTPAS